MPETVSFNDVLQPASEIFNSFAGLISLAVGLSVGISFLSRLARLLSDDLPLSSRPDRYKRLYEPFQPYQTYVGDDGLERVVTEPIPSRDEQRALYVPSLYDRRLPLRDDCPICMTKSPEDAEFCIGCGARFPGHAATGGTIVLRK